MIFAMIPRIGRESSITNARIIDTLGSLHQRGGDQNSNQSVTSTQSNFNCHHCFLYFDNTTAISQSATDLSAKISFVQAKE
jgi:hypothetical protein